MKKMINKSIISIFAIVTMAISCDKSVAVPETVATPPVNVRYDETLSSGTAISVSWEVDAAIANDALAFTVQLVKDTDASFEGASYSHRIKSYEPRPCDTYCFQGLEKRSRYYVRVRSEYKDKCSEWVYFTRRGQKCVVETGIGPVEGDSMDILPPTVRLKKATSASLTFEWTVTDFRVMETDRNRIYKVMLFKDEACSDLYVSWVLNKSAFIGGEAGYVYVLHFPAFVFTGLDARTSYWCRVADITDKEKESISKPVRAETSASMVKIPSGEPVAAGEYALYEDFEELIWGGGATTGAAGYSSLNMSTQNEFVKASGDNPVSTPEKFFVCNENNEYALYQQIPWIISSTRLKNWGHLSEGNVLDAVTARAGCLRLGNSNKAARIVTPPLNNLAGKAAIEVGFDAQNYYVRESRTMRVDVLRDATVQEFTGRVSVAAGNIRKVESFVLEGGYELMHYSFVIYDVEPGDRIGIGAERFGDSTSNIRLYLDNVTVRVLSYK